MFTASYDGVPIDIADYEYPKLELEKDRLTCKFCGSGLTIKHGLIREKHFAHLRDASCDYERLQGEPESREHLALKRWVSDWYKANVPMCKVELEKIVCDGKRIADVFITYPTGFEEVVECQMSSITPEAVLERTADYERYGYPCYWFFASRLLTNSFRMALHHGGIGHVSAVTVVLENEGNTI